MSLRLVSPSSIIPFVVIMMVFAGCTGFVTDNADTDANVTKTTIASTADQSPSQTYTSTTEKTVDQSPSGTHTSTASPTRAISSTPTATQTPTATSVPDNPWGESTLTVGIRDKKGDTRQLNPELQEALDYWEQNSEQYAGYPIEFNLEPDAENPDILVSYVSRIEECGDRNESRIAGCTLPGSPVLVQIETGYTDESIVRLFKHEFGHVLGLTHTDEPSEVMSSVVQMTLLPQPDATERDLPWNHSTLTVAVDLSNVPADERTTVEHEIDEMLDYYDSGADGTVPESVSFRQTADTENADITIQFSGDSPCPKIDARGSGSCHRVHGYDSDGDSSFETYSHLSITLTNLDTEVVRWHAGHQFGYAFGFREPDDWPEQFRPSTSIAIHRSR